MGVCMTEELATGWLALRRRPPAAGGPQCRA